MRKRRRHRGDWQPAWWGPWIFVLTLLIGAIVLWHLIGAPSEVP